MLLLVLRDVRECVRLDENVAGREEVPRRCRRRTRGPTRRRCRAGRDRVEDRVRTQLRESVCVSVALAGCVEAREVIERRRDGDADGVREKSRDRDEEQNMTRTVTVRSHHEMIRVSDRRVCYPQFSQDNQRPGKPGSFRASHRHPTSMHQESTIGMHAPEK